MKEVCGFPNQGTSKEGAVQQVVQTWGGGSRNKIPVLPLSPFHHNWHSLANGPDPASRPGSWATSSPSPEGCAGPSLRPAPAAPSPQRPALPPTWRWAPRGKGAAVSSLTPGSGGGGTAPLTSSTHPSDPGFLVLSRPSSHPSPDAQSPSFSSGGCPPPRLGFPGFQTVVCLRTPSHVPPSFPAQGITEKSPQRPSPSFLPRLRAALGMPSPGRRVPELTLSRQFTFSVGYTILPHRAQLGFMVPGKDWGGDARARARSLFLGRASERRRLQLCRRRRLELGNWPPPPPSFP